MKVAGGTLRFGAFELDVGAGELYKLGRRIRLQEQPLRVLQMLLDRPGELVTREELRARLWPADTFVDFDHGLNNAINRLRETLGDSAENPRFIETIPRRGYRFLAPVSLPAPNAEQVSVVVLPLENLSGDPAQEYFADGMTDSIIAGLAQIHALRVISRTSSMRYKKSEKRVPEIARELNVGRVVEGTVTRCGDRVRISIQLIDGPADRHLWARQYERDLGDVLGLQGEVARTIAQELQVELTSCETARLNTARPVNPAAYEDYLKGRFYWNRRTAAGLSKALEFFRHAIARDPGNALAHAGVADCYNMLAYWGLRAPAEAHAEAKDAAAQALAIDPDLAEAHAALAWPTFVHDWDWTAAASALDRALTLNPGYATAHQWWTHYYVYLCRHQEALVHLRRTLELDPVSRVMHSNAALVCALSGRYSEGVNYARKAVDLDPTFSPSYHWLGLCLEELGELDAAVSAFRQAVEHSGGAFVMLAGMAHACALAGLREEAAAALHRLESAEEIYVSPYYLALIHAGLGDGNAALACLQRGADEHASWMVKLAADPRWKELRRDLRFTRLLERIGLPLARAASAAPASTP